MRIYPLSEGSFTVDSSRTFIPFNPSLDQLSERPRGNLAIACQFDEKWN